jgi:hypothetical protein
MDQPIAYFSRSLNKAERRYSVLAEIWRTKNHVESWHGSFSPNVENGLTCATLTEALRLEQQNTETLITQINIGKIFQII